MPRAPPRPNGRLLPLNCPDEDEAAGGRLVVRQDSMEAPPESNVKQVVPFFWARDIRESVRFYVEGLGFAMTKQWMDQGRLRWCRLELGEAAIMLQDVWRDGPHENVPASQVGVGVSICFQCRDALTLYREFRSRGVGASRPVVGNGMWETHATDPDGYALSFESPTDAPEDAVYSGG
jgi:lactoylglutathione lyase